MDTIEIIKENALKCTACKNVHEYERLVIGEGNPDAPVTIVGQDPGQTELIENKPFCGPSGKVLRETLDSFGITKSHRFITNMNYHRSLNNSGYNKRERTECWNRFGCRLISESSSRIILLVGAKASEIVMESINSPKRSFSERVGKIYSGMLGKHERYFICCIHPGFVLRGGGIGSERHEKMKEQIRPVQELLGVWHDIP